MREPPEDVADADALAHARRMLRLTALMAMLVDDALLDGLSTGSRIDRRQLAGLVSACEQMVEGAAPLIARVDSDWSWIEQLIDTAAGIVAQAA